MFVPCLFFGLAQALTRLKTAAATSQLDTLVALTTREDNKDVDVSCAAPPLTAREHRGLTALIEACGAWAADEASCDDRERPFLTLAAEAAGCTSTTELVETARAALAAVPEPKPKFTIKLQRGADDDEAAPALPPKVVFSPAASYGGARPGYICMTGSKGLGYYLEGTEAPPAPAAAPPPPVPEEPVRYRAGPAWDRMVPAPAPVDEDDAEFELAAAEERKRAAPRQRKAPKPAAPKPAPRPSQWAKAPPVAKKGTGTAKGRLLAKLGKKRR